MLTLGVFLAGPSIDYFRKQLPSTTVTVFNQEVTLSAYRLLWFSGFVTTFITFLLIFFFYHEIDVEEERGIERTMITNDGVFQIYRDVLADSGFWKYLFFSLISIGMKLVYFELSLMFPKLITAQFGQNVYYGVIESISPLFIVAFLFLTSPCTVNLDPYSQIVMGAFFNTFAPIALLFGITYEHIFLFIVLVSLGESLSSPKMYEFVFFFTKRGREGMFLALTAAPQYLTMAVSGYVSGVLLEKFFPQSGERRPEYIWISLISSSGLSLILFLVFKGCFRTQNQGEDIAEPSTS